MKETRDERDQLHWKLLVFFFLNSSHLCQGTSNTTCIKRNMFFILSWVWVLMGTQKFFFVPCLSQDEKHLSLFLYRAQNLPSPLFHLQTCIKLPNWYSKYIYHIQNLYWQLFSHYSYSVMFPLSLFLLFIILIILDE